MEIHKKNPPTDSEVQLFLNTIGFDLSEGFLDFFKESNGAEITIDSDDEHLITLWPLTEMIELNTDYAVEEFAPGFFLFGSNGGSDAYAIEKQTGHIYEMPFIGMSREEAVLRSTNFADFISQLS